MWGIFNDIFMKTQRITKLMYLTIAVFIGANLKNSAVCCCTGKPSILDTNISPQNYAAEQSPMQTQYQKELEAKLELLSRFNYKAQQTIDALSKENNTAKQLSQQVLELKQRNETLEKEKEKTHATIESLQKEQVELNKFLQETLDKNTQLSNRCRDLSSELETLKYQYTEAKKKIKNTTLQMPKPADFTFASDCDDLISLFNPRVNSKSFNQSLHPIVTDTEQEQDKMILDYETIKRLKRNNELLKSQLQKYCNDIQTLNSKIQKTSDVNLWLLQKSSEILQITANLASKIGYKKYNFEIQEIQLCDDSVEETKKTLENFIPALGNLFKYIDETIHMQ